MSVFEMGKAEIWINEMRDELRKTFLATIEHAMPRGTIAAEAVARAVFRLLDRHVSKGQVENVRHSLPHQVAELWQPPVALP